MKSCPKCSRVYADDALNFCLDDGEWLVGSDASEPATAILSGEPPSEANTRAQVTTTYPNSDPSTVSGAPATNAKSYGKLALIVGSIAALAMLAIGAYKYVGSAPKAAPLSFEKAKLTRLTTTGKATNAAISPDGKYVVHVQDDGGQQSLWFRQTVTQSNVQIQPPSAVKYDSLVFSPDGNFVYYAVSGQQFPQRVLFQISTLGGSPKKILEDLDVDTPSFSPDGKQFVFERNEPGVESSIYVADADGSNQRKLIGVKTPPESLGWMAWSPDGKAIVYALRSYTTNDASVVSLNLADGSTKQIGSQRWFRIVGLTWMSDGHSLLMLAAPGTQFIYQVWQISYPDGQAHQLTNDLDDYEWFSLTNDSRSLAVVKQTTQASIAIAPFSEIDRLSPLTSGAGVFNTHATLTPDGTRVLYTSNASGIDDIWIANADRTESPKQLTSGTRINRLPVVSPDGKYIVFLSDRSGSPHLWRMNIDGGDPRQLINGELGEQAAQFSPDGRWIVYMTAQTDRRSIWKVPADGHEGPTRITDKEAGYPTVSPDGRTIAYLFKQSDGSPWRIALAPIEGGEPVKTFELPATYERPLRWASDGRSIAYIDTQNGVSNIVVQPLDGGPIKPLTNFKSDRIFWFDISRDGRQIAVSRGTQSSDVVLISGF
jgi:Tol biopolymer transport system component